MKNISLDSLPLSLFVGYAGENDARGFAFDYSSWTEEYGAGVLQMLLQRPGDANPYPVLLSAGEDGTAVWLPSATDTDVKGKGEIQLIYTVNQVIAKTAVLPVLIERSLGAGTTPPDPYETWVEELLELGNKILQDYQAPKIVSGYWYVYDVDLNEYVNTGVKAEGQDGVGISSAVLNADYTLTLTFSDGASYTTPSIRGEQGETGATPALSIGTVTTLPAGSPATAEMTGTPEAPVLNLGIPQGAKGDPGEVTLADLLKAFPKDNASGAIASFMDGSDGLPFRSLVVNIDPVQDLHGYNNPWPAGGTRNKLKPRTLDELKAINTSGTWSGNTYTHNGISYAWNIFNGYADTVTISGTATAFSRCDIYKNADLTEYSGMVINCGVAYTGGFALTIQGANSPWPTYGGSPGTDRTISTIDPVPCNMFFSIQANTAFDSPLLIQPMIRPASEADSTFIHYSNICPIGGHTDADVTRTGKNLFDKASGAKNLYVGAGDKTGSGGTLLCFLAKKGTQYTISMTGGNRTNLYYYDTTSLDDIVSGITLNVVTLSAAKPYTFIADHDAVYCYYADTNFQQAVADSCMVELGSTATDYEEYRGTTYPIPLGQTVYGGQLDVTTGVLTITSAGTSVTGGFVEATNGVFYKETVFPSVAPSTASEFLSSYFYTRKQILTGGTAEALLYPELLCYQNIGTVVRILIKTSVFASVSDFNTALSNEPLDIVLSIATPITIQLTPIQVELLLGENNIWSAAGDITANYYADPTLYINKKLAAVIAAMS